MEAVNSEAKCTKCEFYRPLGQECRACELARLRTLVGAQQQVIEQLTAELSASHRRPVARGN